MADITVTEHLLLHQKRTPQATGQFTGLLYDLILSGKSISRRIAKAGLLDILGGTGEVNVQGENVQKMDSIANRVMLYRMERCGALCAMSSEEEADLIRVSKEFPRGDYILIFDPLDGSSNIDVNINVGTIFSILRRPEGHTGEVSIDEVLQPGVKQVAAGYILYGPSTMLVLSTGQGVHGFTLDPGVGEFLLSHPDMRIPEQGHIYSVNEGNWKNWDAPAREAVTWFHGCETSDGKPYSSRYVGALVADFHRTLINGGIYMYPPDANKPNGKLRLMCEANPLAFLAEQAGGKASDGHGRILERVPDKLHARTPLYIGSSLDVEAVEKIYARHAGR
ncbi:MAG: class 1 fructose-bisphosphatase [Desulfovibrio sp.]|jgi:fructose-1,6-bisphosphatase I|uniref:class 1 fructose-bisphosphatase n=1 Tax=Desulfovibrio sp. TaxID=885 RepID=UPI00135E89BC|nr:class 1 fructose-bisphosphatase [Desulfovibrio sp.]MTJ92571.1 class 1 fructose-bisphosphatase [Desulfovibrio sp.]